MLPDINSIPNQKIIQVSVVALCDDGTIWRWATKDGEVYFWTIVSPIPQEALDAAK